MNVVMISGRIAWIGDARSAGKSTVIDFGVIHSIKIREKNHKTHVTCQMWGAQIQNFLKYKKKGDYIVVKGALRTNEYEKDGRRRSECYVHVEQLDYGPKR